jgi:hypothetical protein
MIKPKFYGTVNNGKFIHSDPALFEGYIRKFDEGKELEITVAPKKKRRTSGGPGELTNFNGYYWSVIIRMVSDVMGELDDNATHNILQMIFNKKGIEVFDPGTKQKINIEVPRGTKNLTGGEFAEYCSKIRMWASIPGNLTTDGLYIPEPGEADYDE